MESEVSFGTILAALHVKSMIITLAHSVCVCVYMHVFMYVCLRKSWKAYGETLLSVKWDDNFECDVPLQQHTLW